MTKRVISMALALMLVLACFAGVTVSAEETTYTAALGYTDGSWGSTGFRGDSTVQTTVTGAGTYTLSYDTTASGLYCFTIDILGAADDFAASGMHVTALSVQVDGVEIPVDITKIAVGNLENEGNYRIELYNEWGNTKADPAINVDDLNITSNLTVTFTLGTGEEVEPAMELTAALGYASGDWSVSEWGTNVYTTVTGAGEYTLSWDTALTSAAVFVIDLKGGFETITAAGLSVTDLSVLVDGNPIAVDVSKLLCGDIEENGNYRIEIYNNCNGNDNSTQFNPPIDIAELNVTTNLTVKFTLAEKAAEPEMELTAALGYASGDWSVSEWGTNVYTTVTGAGEYTLSWDTALTGAAVFVIDLKGGFETITAAGLCVSDLSVLVDGNPIAVDVSKLLCGDIEENGNYRIEIYNNCNGNDNSTQFNPPIDIAELNVTTNLTITFTLSEKPAEPVALPGEFVTAMGLVSADWGTSTNFGVDSTVQTTVSSEGTVTLTCEAAYPSIGILVVDFVGLQAALDATNQTLQISDLVLTIDGNAVAVDASKVLTGDLEKNGNYRVELCNMVGPSKDAPSIDTSLPVTTNLSLTFNISVVEKPVAELPGVESAEEYRLLIGFQGGKAAGGWDLAYFGNTVDGITAVEATVKSGDTATVSLTFAEPVGEVWYFMPLLVGTGAGEKIGYIDFEMTLKIDGVEVPINWEADADGKTWWAEGTDSFIKEDCIRMGGGYNAFATQYVEKTTGFTTIEYTITFNSIREVEEEEEVIVEIDKMGTYNAYLMLQTPNWTFRNAQDDTFYGIGGSSWEALGLAWGQYLVHQDHPGTTWGVVEDAVIAGNGTYSVKITDFGTVFADDFAAAGQDYFNIIALSTDLPAGANVTITNVELIIDGKVRHTYAEAYINEESTGTLQVLIQNIWNSDVKEISYYPAPTESLEIRFTISGFDYDQEKKDDSGEEVTPTDPQETEPQQTEPQQTEPKATEPVATGNDNNGSVIVIAVVAVVVVGAVAAVLVIKKKKV